MNRFSQFLVLMVALSAVWLPAQTNVQYGWPAASIAVSETNRWVVLRATRSELAGEAVGSVRVLAASSTALETVDFALRNSSLTFRDGETNSSAVVLQLNADDLIEGEEVAQFALEVGGVTSPNPVSIRIADHGGTETSLPTVSFTTDSLRFSEYNNFGFLRVVQVRLDRPAAGSVDIVAVPLSADTNDFSLSNTRVTWPITNSATAQSFYVSITQDDLPEPDEAFELRLVDPVGVNLGSPSLLSAVIDGNDFASDQPLVGFRQSDFRVQSGATEGNTIELTVEVTGAPGPVSVDFFTHAGTATAGSDYVATNGTLTWAAADREAKVIEVRVLDDVLTETNETFDVVLTNAVGGAISATRRRVTIHEAISRQTINGAIGWATNLYHAAESDRVVNLRLCRTVATEAMQGAVRVLELASTAERSDYALLDDTFFFDVGETLSTPVQIHLAADGVAEPEESIVVQASLMGYFEELKTELHTTVRVTDSPGGALDSVGFGAAHYHSQEGIPGLLLEVEKEGTNNAARVSFGDFPLFPGRLSSRRISNPIGPSNFGGPSYSITQTNLTWMPGDASSRFVFVEMLGAQPFVDTLSLPQPFGAEPGAITNTTLTISANDLGFVEFTDTVYPVREGDLAVIAVRRSDTNTIGRVRVQMTGSRATPLFDYVVLETDLTWSAGETGLVKQIEIPTLTDLEIEDDELISLSFSPVGGLQIGSNSTAYVLIIDPAATNRTPVFSFGPTEGGSESANDLRVAVDRVGGEVPASVRVSTGNSYLPYTPATAEVDYTPVDAVLNWETNSPVRQWVPLPLIDDDVAEDTEYFQVNLHNATNGGVSFFGRLVSIESDELIPSVAVSTPATVSESQDHFAVVISRRRPWNAADGADYLSGRSEVRVTVTNTTHEHSSFAPFDQIVIFEPGESNQTVTIQLINDEIPETSECVNVEVRLQRNALSYTYTSREVCIEDDDGGVGVELLATETSVLEGDGHARVGLVRRDDGLPASVTVVTEAQTALAGVDFIPLTNTITWLAHDDERIKYLDIPILDDSVEETNSVVLNLRLEPQANTVMQVRQGQVRIHDDDGTNAPLGAVFSAGQGFDGRGPAHITIYEHLGVQTIPVNRAGGIGPASVGYRLIGETATVGIDVEPAEGRVTWSQGDHYSKGISVSVIDDLWSEGTETLKLVLFDPVGGRIEQPINTVSLSEAIRYEPGMVEFLDTNYVVVEGGIVEVRLQRHDPNGRLELQPNLTGTAANGFDFGLTNGAVVWEEGDVSPKSLLIFTHEDGLIESPETIDVGVGRSYFLSLLGVSEPTNPPPTTQVTILDSGNTNAVPTSLITLATNRLYVRENQAFVDVHVTRYLSDGHASVELFTESGSGSAGEDFVSVSTNVVFPPRGSFRQLRSFSSTAPSGAQTVVVPIPVLDDQLAEPGEFFTVSLRHASNATVLGVSSTVVHIEDNESPTRLEFVGGDFFVDEGDWVGIWLVREGPGSGPVQLEFGGTAGSEDWFPLASNLVVFPPNSSSRIYIHPLQIHDDTLIESNETIEVRMTPAGGNFVFGDNTNLTITIRDNDPQIPAVVQFAQSQFIAEPGATNARLRIVRSGSPARGSVVVKITAVGLARYGHDVLAGPLTVAWESGDPDEKFVDVQIRHPADAEPAVRFTVTLESRSNLLTLGANSVAELIVRRTPDPVSISYGLFTGWSEAGNMDQNGIPGNVVGRPSGLFAGRSGDREFRNWFRFVAPTNQPNSELCRTYLFFGDAYSTQPTNLTYQLRQLPDTSLAPPTNDLMRLALFQQIGNASIVSETNIATFPHTSETIYQVLPPHLIHGWLSQPGSELLLGGAVAGAGEAGGRRGVMDSTATSSSLAFILFEYCDLLPALDLTRSAERRLPIGYTPGKSVTVRIVAGPVANTQSYALEDLIPAGWIATYVSHDGTFDPATGKVKFGPYHDDAPRLLSYEMSVPPEAEGDMTLAGVISVDGVNVAIRGDQILQRQPQHPADRDPADWRMEIAEVTAFGNAWRTESAWPIGPQPIPIDYVTSAAWLWRNGEQYRSEPSASGALAWTPIQSLTAAGLSGLSGQASSDLPGGFQSGRTMDVRIVVTPPAGVGGWAVEEDLPDGWTVSAVSDNGSVSATGNRVKWGPFLEAGSRTLSYRLRPEGSDTHATITGRASFDGRSRPIRGRRHLQRGAWITADREQVSNLQSHGFRLRWRGQTGHQASAEYTTDFINWHPLPTSALQTIGDELELTDADSSGQAQRFYRIRETP